MPTLLSDLEKAQIRHHGGYTNVDPIVSQQLGVPGMSQESFVVEAAMTRIRPEAVGLIRTALTACNDSEKNLLSAQRRLKVKQVGNVTLRDDECDKLEREYSRWTKRLYEDLGAPRNPYSSRFKDGPPGLVIPVHLV